jgi:hypothetical protein
MCPQRLPDLLADAEERQMSSLCNAISAQIDDILQGESVSSREVRADRPDQCSIITDRFIIIFYRDNGGGLITSTIKYLDAPEIFRENIPSYTICKMLPIFLPDYSKEIVRSPYDIKEEINNVKVILRVIRENNISFREIFFFFMGHCEGYTQSNEYVD